MILYYINIIRGIDKIVSIERVRAFFEQMFVYLLSTKGKTSKGYISPCKAVEAPVSPF
jgi:hypothetical protein